MPALALWGGRLGLAWLGAQMFSSVADTAKAGEESVSSITKAAPWIVAGLAVYLIAQRVK